jgi:hypothetical protein
MSSGQGQPKNTIFTKAFELNGLYAKRIFFFPINTWFETMVFRAPWRVSSGATSPPAFFAGGLPRRRLRRRPFELFQVFCTSSEIARQSSPPRRARRLARSAVSGQKQIRLEKRKFFWHSFSN